MLWQSVIARTSGHGSLSSDIRKTARVNFGFCNSIFFTNLFHSRLELTINKKIPKMVDNFRGNKSFTLSRKRASDNFNQEAFEQLI